MSQVAESRHISPRRHIFVPSCGEAPVMTAFPRHSMGSRPFIPLAFAAMTALLLAGCTTERRTAPSRTATEQLMISAAADRAAQNLSIAIPAGTKVFVDSTWFEGTDSKYAIAAIRDRLLRRGAHLVEKREQAAMIVELRSGALSIDENSLIVGIPQLDVPIPLAGSLGVPEIALFKRARRQGVAKFAATGYDAETGKLISSSASDFGFSQQTEFDALFFISWTTSDVMPEETGKILGPSPTSAHQGEVAKGSPGSQRR
ncbi:hypothetical protein Plav_0759 [Parvibaculum lavamentivorans DS-1]|uniref:Uncharacterized protein n=1 Tax=Parvibaculum lavamentivorans (strain DS-1 / DSM 13023 / NCIMB 13966) TaxID=402881 RepID=A7HR49_PARL1|nr:DUF6655 family protein [Parvibaculum lavamentivorans]ABS62382.1 hypothetical protein Plav_0759 [Parvibaculum lavamentivorans DS-1]